jgi:hypothetical protein
MSHWHPDLFWVSFEVFPNFVFWKMSSFVEKMEEVWITSQALHWYCPVTFSLLLITLKLVKTHTALTHFVFCGGKGRFQLSF